MGNVAYNYAKYLSSKHDISIFTPRYSNEVEEFLGFKAIYIKPLLKLGNGAFIPSVFFKLRKFDIIHLHYPFFGGAELVWLAKLFGAKFKLVIHYHMDTGNLSPLAKILSFPSRLIEKSLLRQADKITCASIDYIENSKISLFYNKYKEKFFEIPFGVDVSKFKYLGPPQNNTKRILFVSALDKAHFFKGVDNLLEAASEINNNYKLVIAGGGDMRNNYINKARRLGILHKVVFPGKLSDVDLVKEYQKADIFILPSINSHEAFGLVLLEAMSCATPVIASSLPGVRTVFTDNSEGIYIKPNSVDSLKESLTKMLKDDDMRVRMSNNALKLVKNKYSWEVVAKKLDGVYRNLD